MNEYIDSTQLSAIFISTIGVLKVDDLIITTKALELLTKIQSEKKIDDE
jgi:hypothetical protein